ncbi:MULTISPECIES: hypothetical protein [Thermomonospora]|uniref:Uncharacterized protein n=1 Tax=Thermomonospora cellulosilytica TaxID=1411118 RepID=A0A7W3MST7_9ACTN|nr:MULTISPECIES: hypothetical protein [Thermomonospora]MBA9001234.1 hypothetical protein [Thermomonospora cellulosilytica]
MTERSPGAPDPAGGPPCGDGAAQQPAGAFWNLAAIRRSDDLMEALASRGPLPAADPADGADDPDGADPAARLLRALVADVDAGAPALPDRRTGSEQPPAADEDPDPGGPRRGPRTIVVLGIVGPLLTGVLTTGVAAATGGFIHRPGSAAGADERPDRRDRPEARSDRGQAMPGPWRRPGPTPPTAVREPAEADSLEPRLRRRDTAPQDPPPSTTQAPVVDRPGSAPGGQTPVPDSEGTPTPEPSRGTDDGQELPPAEPIEAPSSSEQPTGPLEGSP